MADGHARLRTATTVDQLLVRAATFARTDLGFDRALVVLVQDGHLHGSPSAVLEDEPSDWLRRELLGHPQRVEPGTEAQQTAVATLAAVVAAVFEVVVLRARVAELSDEIRSLTASARALIDETLQAPIMVPVDRGRGPMFPRVDAMSISCAALPAEDFSERERQIAALLIAGRSNQEIADELILSRETVKGHVRQILRKTGASNRVEAVSRLLTARAAS